MTVNELIETLKSFSEEGHADSEVFVLVGANDVRPIPSDGVDEWFSNNAVWIKIRVQDVDSIRKESKFRELMDGLNGPIQKTS